MKWIRALNLEQWAETTGSRTALSELISALVRASASEIRAFRFPAGDSAQIPGYDGRLTATGVAPFVPDGDSVWEFGVSADYLEKASGEYETRTSTPGAVNPAETTFVFVTPRTWRSAKIPLDQWQDERHASGPWKDVRVFDGVGLEDWCDQHPAVASRFARYELGLWPQNGARSTAEFWDEYAARFKPALTEQVLLCARDDQASELLERLAAGPQDIVLKADSPDEVIAFAIAAIRGASNEVQKFLEARTLVLDTEEAARQLAMRQNLIFIPRGSALAVSGLLARHGPTVVPLGRDAVHRRGAVALNRPSRYDLGEAIATMGFDADEAQELARACGRSVTILARRIPSGDAPRPPWANGQRTLIPALIAGGWDASSDHDQTIVQALAGGPSYADYEATLHHFLRVQDPPIDQEGSVWKIRAPVDAFVHLGHLIGRADLDRLRVVAADVFSEYDSALDLPDESRPFSAVDRPRLRHSGWLREGLATTLLQIAVLHEEGELRIPGISPPLFVQDIIEQLPGLGRDHRLLASLRNELPLLMEAAPHPLLSALERLLEGDGSPIRPIFHEGGFLSPSSPHTGLLSALEVLAWDPEHLTRVALLLAKLARVDPGGRLSNRPINTLREIFLPWHPSTNSTLSQRMAALDCVAAREPNIAWELVVKLLPETHDAAHTTVRPRHREAGASEQEVLTWGLVFKGYREVVGRALDLAGDQPQRWAVIIQSMANFEPALRARVYDLLETYVARATPEQRMVVWSALRDEVNRHRAFQAAEWALSEPELTRLDAILESLRPEDPLQRIGWLFEDFYPEVPKQEGARERDAVEEAREDAVRAVYSTRGNEGLLALADSVKLPQFVAAAAGGVLEAIGTFDALIDGALGKSERLDTFALVLSGQAERKFGPGWAMRVAARAKESRWTTEQIATLLFGWRDQPTTWDIAASLGEEAEQSYWRRKTAWPLDGDTADLQRAARKYLAVGRATSALDAVHDHVGRLPICIVFELLDAAVRQLNAGGNPPTNMFLHNVKEIFEALSKREDAPPLEVAKREYVYLPLFGYHHRNLTLHRLMAEEPSVFVLVLCDVFKPASGAAREPTEELRARAKAGFQLLHSFEILPGEHDGEIDAAVLRAWVNEVRRLAAEEDRAQIADQYVGHVLAHAPKDPRDNAWPHRVVRDRIEELASDDVEVGISIERHNMRGTYWKGVFEGGKQERALAEEARCWAKATAAHPRTSMMLHRIARSWEAEAEREDERARLDQMRFE